MSRSAALWPAPGNRQHCSQASSQLGSRLLRVRADPSRFVVIRSIGVTSRNRGVVHVDWCSKKIVLREIEEKDRRKGEQRGTKSAGAAGWERRVSWLRDRTAAARGIVAIRLIEDLQS